MLSDYLAIGSRALRRDPLFTAINLFGLAVGLAGCLLIILFIRYERSFDDWLPGADRIYQVHRIVTSGTDTGRREGQTAYVAASALPRGCRQTVRAAQPRKQKFVLRQRPAGDVPDRLGDEQSPPDTRLRR